MVRRTLTCQEALSVRAKIDPKYKPIFDQYSQNEMIALIRYFFSSRSAKAMLKPTRPFVVHLYNIFASQTDFPSGHRYSINVYAGCSFGCLYCYARGYEPQEIHTKKNFKKYITADMMDLEELGVPPAPVHISISVDPFQPVEEQVRHTLYTLREILKHRTRFTTVTVLTKNPLLAAEPAYIELFTQLAEFPDTHPKLRALKRKGQPGLIVEVSIAFWREEAACFYDGSSPSIAKRFEGIRLLRRAGIPVVLRIDPLLPRSPVRDGWPRNMADFDLPEAQKIDDLVKLVTFAKEVDMPHVVYSVAKIVQPRGKLTSSMKALRDVYEACAELERLDYRHWRWRLPASVADGKIVSPFLGICRQRGVLCKHCVQNLIETP